MSLVTRHHVSKQRYVQKQIVDSGRQTRGQARLRRYDLRKQARRPEGRRTDDTVRTPSSGTGKNKNRRVRGLYQKSSCLLFFHKKLRSANGF